MIQLTLDRDSRTDKSPTSICAYHYAVDTDRSPEMVALPVGCDSEWSEADRRLRLYRGPLSPAIYYCDDGWRLSWGTNAGAVKNRLGASKHLLRELPPGFEVQVTSLGAETPISMGSGSRPRAHVPDLLRMLALVTDAYGGHGGIARYNRDFFDVLAASDAVNEIQILPRTGRSCSGDPRYYSNDSESPVRQLNPTFSKWRYSLRAFFLTLTLRPNVLFCGHLHMTPLAAVLSWLFRAPLWVQVHGVEVFERRGPLIRWALRRASLVTAVSRYTRSKLLEWAAIPAETVRVLPNTLDARYRPGDRQTLKTRRGYAGYKIILTVSRLDAREQYKGHEQVLAAIPALLKQHSKLIYLIAGDGSDRARLEKFAIDGGVAAHVHFLGRVGEPELLELYQMADVFAMPSTGEGFGIVFLEAAACGCAVVGGDRDGSVDALGEGVIGAAVNPHDAAALQAALHAALERLAPDAERVSRFRRARFEQHLNDLLSSILTNRQMPR